MSGNLKLIMKNISELPFMPRVLSFMIDFFSTILSLTSVVFIFKYYGSLSVTQKTIISSLMRVLMVTSGLLVTWFMIIKYVHILGDDPVREWYTEEPQLACSLLSLMVPNIICLTNLFFVLCAKCYMMADTMNYLSLDHDRLSNIILLLLITLVVGEITFLFLIYGTLCPKLKLEKIKEEFDIALPENIKNTPPVVMIHELSLLVPECIFQLIKFMKQRKKSRYNKFTTI